MRRRFVLCIAACLVASIPALGQSRALPRVVLVSSLDPPRFMPARNAFIEGMKEIGHVDGRTYVLEVAYAHGEENLPRTIAQAVGTKPSMIVVGGLLLAKIARESTSSIPIVVWTASDPVKAGLVDSLAHPGGNLTGLGDSVAETIAKRIELAAELLPNARTIALIIESAFPTVGQMVVDAKRVAAQHSLNIVELPFDDAASLQRALGKLSSSRADVVLTLGSSATIGHFAAISAAAREARIPLIHFWLPQADQGALATHGADPLDNMRRATRVVDRILKGSKPGDIPFDLTTRFQLVVNLSVARTLGVKPPQAILLRADRVIE